MKPKLSVVICTYNRAKSLAKCLKSLTQQSFANFEVIIVDGGSTDQTQQVINQYSQILKIKKIIDKTDQLVQARDRGWRKAQGQIVSWIDDDVAVSKNWVQSIVKILDNNPDIAGVTGPTIIPKKLLANRDIFSFYESRYCHSEAFVCHSERSKESRRDPSSHYAGLRMTLIRYTGKIWNKFFLEGKKYQVGRIFKSGAWSPGSNFPSSLKIKGLKEVDYLEACNMSLRKSLVAKVNGFDLSYQGIGEWSELDLAIRIKNLGYRLVFSPKARVSHHISQKGVYQRRTQAKQRMENFLKFYFRHIFRFQLDYLIKFLPYLLFLNLYWAYKALTTWNLNWLGGWLGTISGLKAIWQKPKS